MERLPLIGREKVPKDARTWLSEMFAQIPSEESGALTVLRLCAGDYLTRMEDRAVSVWFLVCGQIASVNEQLGGLNYHFAVFRAPAVFGEFEAFAGSAVYRSTLVCETDCLLLQMPRAQYLSWMQKDAAILYKRTCAITKNLVEQARHERDRLFCSGEQKLAGYICALCRQETPQNGQYTLRRTMQQMADGIGASPKTVQRALKAFALSGLIEKTGHSIRVAAKNLRALEARCNPTNSQGEIKP